MAYKPTLLTPAEGGTGANNTAASGKILIGDGTNFISSTPTYPLAAGTSGNVLTSDGTNWTSAAASGGTTVLVASGTLTSAQIKALHATPITAIAAQGSGTVIEILWVTIKLTYGGTNVFTAAASQTVSVYYSNVTSIGIAMTNAGIVAASSQLTTQSLSLFTPAAYTAVNNTAVRWYNPVVTEIGGNAANNNTMPWEILYKVVTI